MRAEKIGAVICGLALEGLLCGCGRQTDGLVIVGENASEQIPGTVMRASDGEQETEAAGKAGVAGEDDAAGLGLEEASKIYVYVCGAVNSPGVVILQEGSRAEAALAAAGGFRQDARTDCVNLAAKVSDGEKLYFPTLAEQTESFDEDAGDGLVNINTAGVEDLCTLSGIGESRARDILRYREENGPFQSCEDIMKVPGIKTGVYGKIKDKIKTE